MVTDETRLAMSNYCLLSWGEGDTGVGYASLSTFIHALKFL